MKQKDDGRIMQKKKKIKAICLTSFLNDITGGAASFYVKLPGIFVFETFSVNMIAAHLTFRLQEKWMNCMKLKCEGQPLIYNSL